MEIVLGSKKILKNFFKLFKRSVQIARQSFHLGRISRNIVGVPEGVPNLELFVVFQAVETFKVPESLGGFFVVIVCVF